MNIFEYKTKDNVNYEYKEVTVEKNLEHVCSDGYMSLGYTLENEKTAWNDWKKVKMRFKRDRNIRNRAELGRLQCKLDACIRDISTDMQKKSITAVIIASILGVIGTILVAGSAVALTYHILFRGTLLAAGGFAVWLLAFFCYRLISKLKRHKFRSQIDEKIDEIRQICDKGFSLMAK